MLLINIDRPIDRQTTSGGGVVYFYGSGDNFIQFTLLCSTPEIASLNTLTQRNANGGLNINILENCSQKSVIMVQEVPTKTITAAGTLPHLEVARLEGVGGVVMRGRIQLTGDTISSSIMELFQKTEYKNKFSSLKMGRIAKLRIESYPFRVQEWLRKNAVSIAHRTLGEEFLRLM